MNIYIYTFFPLPSGGHNLSMSVQARTGRERGHEGTQIEKKRETPKSLSKSTSEP